MESRSEVSAGGVVYRRDEGSIELALAARRTRRGELAWGLAKGAIEAGESEEQAAVREVLEEPGLEVLLSFDASSSLAAQIVAGSPADVFASADLAQIEVVAEEGLVQMSEGFAVNRLQVITPADDPGGVEEPEDLARADVSVVLAAEEVPVGNYARRFFDELGILDEVEANVVSNEQDVKDVLTKIRLGFPRCRPSSTDTSGACYRLSTATRQSLRGFSVSIAALCTGSWWQCRKATPVLRGGKDAVKTR